MFSKKILSIVALLFLGHQVSRVSAENCVISSSDGDKNCNVDTADGCTKGFVIAKSVSKFNYAYNKDSPASGDNEILIEITGDNNACNVKTSPGYYTDGTNHYSVNYNLAVAPVGEESSCDGNAGKFKTGGTAFCVASGKELGLDDGKKYLFTDADTILTKNAANNVILKSDANSITLDKEAMEYNYNYCVDSNAVVWDRKADLCNDEKAGECTYYSCASGTCTENTKNIPPTNEKRMGDCDLANPNENCGEGDYYLYGKDDTTKAKITTVTGGTFVLVQCVTDQETKKCKIPSAIPTGYLVNAGVGEGNAKYIKCNGRVCEPVASITDARISEISPGINMISINSDEFLGVYQDSGKYITVVKDATGNVIVEQVAGYYITTHDSSLVQNDTTGDLYLCADEDGTIKCEQVTNAKPIGYLINAGVGDSDKRYIKCQANGDCGAYAPGDQNSCGNNHGDLYVVGEDTKVCGVENDDDELVLAGTNAITGQYFASVDTANDQLFGIANKAGYHIVLDFSGGAVTVDNTATRYRYTLKGKTAITARTDAHSLSADGQICKASNGSRPNAYEYVLANWVDATKDLTANIAYYVTEEYGKAA